MATVTDLRPILPEYETLYRVNQELKGEKQAYKRLSKEHLWTIFKMAIGALMIAAGAAANVAFVIIGLNNVMLTGNSLSEVAIRFIIMVGGDLALVSGADCAIHNYGIHKDQVNEKQSRKETIQRLKAESEAIANNIKASA